MRIVPWAIVSVVILSSTLAGCIHTNDTKTVEIIEDERLEAYSIVAPIDTGINVYHQHFILNETLPDWMLNGLGVTMWCNITKEGTWEERYEADKETCWDIITSSDIVYFTGTRIIGTTPDDSTDIPILDDPSDGHGTAVTGLSLIHI